MENKFKFKIGDILEYTTKGCIVYKIIVTGIDKNGYLNYGVMEYGTDYANSGFSKTKDKPKLTGMYFTVIGHINIFKTIIERFKL